MSDTTNKLKPDFSHRLHGHPDDNALDGMLNTIGIMVERASGLLEVAIDHIYSDATYPMVLYAASAELKDIDAVIAAFHKADQEETAKPTNLTP
jgi:hypothetical protein